MQAHPQDPPSLLLMGAALVSASIRKVLKSSMELDTASLLRLVQLVISVQIMRSAPHPAMQFVAVWLDKLLCFCLLCFLPQMPSHYCFSSVIAPLICLPSYHRLQGKYSALGASTCAYTSSTCPAGTFSSIPSSCKDCIAVRSTFSPPPFRIVVSASHLLF